MIRRSLLSWLGASLLSTAPLQAADAPDALAAWEADRSQVFNAAEIDLDAFQWAARPIVVFANSPRDPAFVEQIEELQRSLDDLAERDVVLITDTDPDARSDLRQQLRPRGFMLVLIAKDGTVNLRKPFPWSVRELSRSIDKMPIRQREIQDRR